MGSRRAPRPPGWRPAVRPRSLPRDHAAGLGGCAAVAVVAAGHHPPRPGRRHLGRLLRLLLLDPLRLAAGGPGAGVRARAGGAGGAGDGPANGVDARRRRRRPIAQPRNVRAATRLGRARRRLRRPRRLRTGHGAPIRPAGRLPRRTAAPAQAAARAASRRTSCCARPFRAAPGRPLHVRHRHRVQLPDDRGRPLAHGPARRDASLPVLAPRSRARPRAGPELPALRPAAAPDPPRPRPVRLVVHGRRLRCDAAPRHRADHRPVPLRRARVAGELPEPALPRMLRRVRGRIRSALPPGPPLHAGQRNVRHRALERTGRVVERAAPQRARLRDGGAAPGQGEPAVDAGDPPPVARRSVRCWRAWSPARRPARVRCRCSGGAERWAPYPAQSDTFLGRSPPVTAPPLPSPASYTGACSCAPPTTAAAAGCSASATGSSCGS